MIEIQNRSYIKRKVAGIYRYPHNGLTIYYKVWKQEVRSNFPWMMVEILFDEKTKTEGKPQATAIRVEEHHWQVFRGNRVA